MDEHEYDLAIIGGGINGAAIARDATLRGLKVILLEKKDFACGASSKNSKLAHGGLRYLEHFQFSLVKESLRERSRLLKSAPNLVKKLPFIIPVYKKDQRPLWKIKLGLYLYDLLGSGDLEKHHNLSSDQILDLFPQLNKENLCGGCLYYDAIMQDNRLVIENVLAAEDHGATILNYTPVTDFILKDGKMAGVVTPQGKIHAKVVVNATGAWSNQILQQNGQPALLYPTKGIHLVLPRFHATHALLLFAPQDGRVFFLIPWNGYSLLGSTDTPYQGDPDHVSVDAQNIDYLLTALNHYFPRSSIIEKNIIASFAGLRPLVHRHHENPSKISRDHLIQRSPTGLISILGGKYTTYRQMAEELVDNVVQQLHPQDNFGPCETAEKPLCALQLADAKIKILAQNYGVSEALVCRLVEQYGQRFQLILDIIKEDPAEAQPLCAYHPHVGAELLYSIRHEKVKTAEDWFERRTSIAYTECRGLLCAQVVLHKLQREKDGSNRVS